MISLVGSMLQAGIESSLAFWFIASVALVVLVTLIYVFFLSKSPPPPGMTVEKVEAAQRLQGTEPDALITKARDAIAIGNVNQSIEFSTNAIGMILSFLLERAGIPNASLGLSDMAYLVQTKAKASPDISQPVYQLNLLRLKSLQGENVTAEQADWAINAATWLAQLAHSEQIVL
jgi:hypothetical protein